MYCLLRDDDISFLSSSLELERSWGWYFAHPYAKLNLAVIPFAEPAEWGKPGHGLCPLGDNKELTRYIKEKIGQGKVEILLHGYSHSTRDARFEFASRNVLELAGKVREGRQYLERLFGRRVTVFVPPHNALSGPGISAVAAEGMAVLSATSLSPFKVGLNPENLCLYSKRLAFSLQYRKTIKGKYVYPFVVRRAGCVHLDCLTVIPDFTTPSMLRSYAEIVEARGGILCLATHYWEMDGAVKTIMQDLVSDLVLRRQVQFAFASEIMGGAS